MTKANAAAAEAKPHDARSVDDLLAIEAGRQLERGTQFAADQKKVVPLRR